MEDQKQDRKLLAILASQDPWDGISKLSADTINKLSADTISNLSADTISKLSADTISNLSADTISNLSADTISKLSAYTISKLSADTINNLSAYTISKLSADTISNLSADTISKLSADTISKLSADTISKLSADTISKLSADTISKLSAYTINNLSAYTISKLSKNLGKDIVEAHKAFWDAIPKLDKPYTKLLNDIREKKRTHNQSTYGPECDPAANICGTPMCTAGHLVNMAGEAGYKLKSQFGWSGAATLIHRKAHPNYPRQNFGTIPQEWALAYIEEMAEWEAAEETEK